MQEPDFVKYPEIPHLAEALDILDSDNLQVFEKLDGGNCQVRMFNGRLFCGSRANFLKRPEHFRFRWFKDFHRWAMSNGDFYKLPEELVVYGEFTSPHTIPYKSKFTNKFFLIDVYDLNKQRFMPYSESKNTLETKLGIGGVLFLDPLIEGKVDPDSLKDLAMEESPYSNYGREGIVVKDYPNQKFAKLWRTSANKTREGLIEEIQKTIKSLEVTGFLYEKQRNSYGGPASELESPYGSFRKGTREKLRSYGSDVKDALSREVYTELVRSGRLDVSMAEIADTIERVTNKI